MSNPPRKKGSCDAIFSNFAVNFNNEETTPVKSSSNGRNYPSFLATDTTDNLDKPLHDVRKPTKSAIFPPKREESSKSKDPERPQFRKTPRKPKTHFFENPMDFESYQSPSKPQLLSPLSSDKTPNTNKTPNPRNRESTEKGGVQTSTPFRTPAKRFFTDPLVTQSTPDCFGTVQLETPRPKKKSTGNNEVTICEGESSNLTVGVRIRPMNSKELNASNVTAAVDVKGTKILVDYEQMQHSFTYDYCFTSNESNEARGSSHVGQETIFRTMVQPLVDNAFEGYNVCLFAYGQTGSGKSYSMMGSDMSHNCNSLNLPEGAGIIPRFCHEIFSRAAKNEKSITTVEISYFEIYNEKIHDLLTSNANMSGKKRAPLKVREHPVFGPYVVDLSQHCIQNYEDLQIWLKVGNSQKATAATEMNEKSSRSHSIFSIILTQSQKNVANGKSGSSEFSRRSKINLVDLAGSERLSQTGVSGERLREGVSINKSLLTLGKVIASLAECTNNRKRGFVPYRESILTWLLKESLGGNSKTAMLATISPSSLHVDETLATLRYACQARSIINRVRINEDPHDKLIRELKAEILRLRGVRERYEKQTGSRQLSNGNEIVNFNDYDIFDKEREIEKLRNQLKHTEEQLTFTQRSWSEKLKEAEERRNSEVKFLRQCGIAVEIDFRESVRTPCLIHLAPDPILSGTLLYLLPPGIVRIGKNSSGARKSSGQVDILLSGPLVAPLHCTIENKNKCLTLIPESNSDTYLNGQMVQEKIPLKNGDRLVIGGNHYFKVYNPSDNNLNLSPNPQSIDYEFAHKEISNIQDEKLRTELEESKQRAIKELEKAKRDIELQFGAQKINYEKEIKCLGSTLENQRLALADMKKKKRELEIEKEILAHQVKKSDLTSKISAEEVEISPYRSNFLPELEKLLTSTTLEAETVLTSNCEEITKVDGVTLHGMQLLIREATGRCQENGSNYEFLQQRVITDDGLKPMIRVRDKKRKLEAFWEPRYFLDWVNRLRDEDADNFSADELMRETIKWEDFEDNQNTRDSLDNSRISINLTPIKKQLNESFLQLSMNGSILDEGPPGDESAHEEMKKCLMQMDLAAKKLDNLCHQHENKEISKYMVKSLGKMNSIMQTMRDTLNFSQIERTAMTNCGNLETDKGRKIGNKNGGKENECRKTPSKRGRNIFQQTPTKTVRFDVQ